MMDTKIKKKIPSVITQTIKYSGVNLRKMYKNFMLKNYETLIKEN